MELTQRRPSSAAGATKFRSVVAKARAESLDHVNMLTSVDDNDADNELLFESIDHRINSVENMLSRNKANKENEWKRKIGVIFLKIAMVVYYFVALPWFLAIYLNFKFSCFTFDYIDGSDKKCCRLCYVGCVRRSNLRKEKESDEKYSEEFDGLNDDDLEALTKFEIIEQPKTSASPSIQNEYREFQRREKMLEQKQTVYKKPEHYMMQERFMDYETWEENRSVFVVSELFENNSYPKFAKDKLSSRRKSYLYDLEALDHADPKHVEMIHARAAASRKLYHFARKIYRKELENENLKEYTSFADEVKKHWKEVCLTFGAFWDSLCFAVIVGAIAYFAGEYSDDPAIMQIFSETLLPLLTGQCTATLFIFVLYMYTLKGQETREWLDRSLISFLGIQADVILGSTIHFYFVLSLLPMFLVFFIFNWFAAPRFGLKCRAEDPGHWDINTPSVFTCANSSVVVGDCTTSICQTETSTICCQVENNRFAPFIFIAFLFANAKASMALIAIIADFFLEVKKGAKELGGGSIFVAGRSEKLPSLLNARKTSRAKRAVNSRRGSKLMSMKEITDHVVHQGIWCSGPNCIPHDGEERRDIVTSGVAWHHKNRLCHFCDECFEETDNKKLFKIANASPLIWGTKNSGGSKPYNERKFNTDYYQATTPGESYEFMWNNLVFAFGKPRSALGIQPMESNPYGIPSNKIKTISIAGWSTGEYGQKSIYHTRALAEAQKKFGSEKVIDRSFANKELYETWLLTKDGLKFTNPSYRSQYIDTENPSKNYGADYGADHKKSPFIWINDNEYIGGCKDTLKLIKDLDNQLCIDFENMTTDGKPRLAIAVEDFYKEMYRLANIEEKNYTKRSPLSFARYINVERVMEEYIQNREDVEESNVNSFDHTTYAPQCIENEEQLKWFLMAFAEVGFKFKVGDVEKEKAEAQNDTRSRQYTYNGFFPGINSLHKNRLSKVRNEFINEKPSPGLFRKKPITTEIGYEVVQDGKNEVVQDGSAETDLIPIWTGYLNQFVDKDNQFYEGSNPMNDGELDSFNYIQDHKDEKKLKTFDLGVLQLGRIKKETKSRRWSKLRGAVKGGHVHKSHTKHKSLHIKHTSREVKEDQPVNNTNSHVIQINPSFANEEEKKKNQSKNQSKRSRRISKVIKARRNSAETMLGLVPMGVTSKPSNETKKS